MCGIALLMHELRARPSTTTISKHSVSNWSIEFTYFSNDSPDDFLSFEIKSSGFSGFSLLKLSIGTPSIPLTETFFKLRSSSFSLSDLIQNVSCSTETTSLQREAKNRVDPPDPHSNTLIPLLQILSRNSIAS